MGKIRLRHGNSEIELEGDEGFIERQLTNFYERFKVDPSAQIAIENQSARTEIEAVTTLPVDLSQSPTPAEYFLKTSQGKSDGITQILVFASYLAQYAKKSEFSRKQINELVAKAKLPKDIHSQYFSNAVQSGFLRNDKPGIYSLTLTGEGKLGSSLVNTSTDTALPIIKPHTKTRKTQPRNSVEPKNQSPAKKFAKAASITLEKFDPHSTGDQPSLEQFFREKVAGSTSGEKLAIIAYYITQIKGAISFSEGNIDYAYRILRLGERPAHLRQVLLNNKNRFDLFDFDDTGNRWVLTRTGTITVEDKLPRQSE